MGEDLSDVRALIERIPLFAEVLDPGQIATLAAKATVYAVPPRTVLMSEGDYGDSMFAVIDGAVEVTVEGARSGSREVAMLGPGDIVGEMSLMTGARRTATVTSVVQTRVLQIRKAALEAVLAHSPDLVIGLGAMLARRQIELERISEDEHAQRILGLRASEIVAAIRRFFFPDQAERE
ncbi:Crp/Fnr family transcriptional regulator [Prosthecomicrobium pneumaticum]|uniref:CRP-like cAMP-binding protein n=1 Tax=Prosthecomicrobium pneumaticum TaxID=81895 RepID=A0A7W9CUA4_9HYPH|nr:cyclic nucleotide-binding domain-containing protein [Prosthecomicrobium pneumaticum]MBB5751764.1 CRP-like cAMP-binding protein [Prosthecomicrobium pneumaticum]